MTEEVKRLFVLNGEPVWLTPDEADELDDPEGSVTIKCTLSATLFNQLGSYKGVL